LVFYFSGYHGILALAKQPKIFIGMVLIQAFASVLGLYGLLVGLTMLAA
jgi:V-type H+-transporting ATPase proteolipid subunit